MAEYVHVRARSDRDIVKPYIAPQTLTESYSLYSVFF